MRFTPLEIPDVILIEPDVIEDDRGFFLESYQKERFAAAGILAEFIQDNHSASVHGVLRGLHYQVRHTQGKLVRVVVGKVFDAAVDMRRTSATFGRSVSCLLSAETKNQVWVPPGFAHGFYVISDRAELLYKATDYYAPEWERTLLWNDPALAIQWPLVGGKPPVLSKKDAEGKRLTEAETFD